MLHIGRAMIGEVHDLRAMTTTSGECTVHGQ
jgi:hypothetical protein